ncbi:MAG: hypothetical protein DWQ34_03570 [Planctomycetota bacterium]|nr:MAG: hypothetical protein DWQ34_03570 [Planctomycetota bacterium]REK24724.1 MAG: hypothetical protein DWQ41_13390 [Planctomycetota bacterium]REK29995.1 MAG: hypothetical protein DWQ45_22075 [Planctomycetota bacterium]
MDERRRRRLAQEADQETQPERRGPVRARPTGQGGSREVEERRPPASPAESVVRPQLWAHVVISTLTLCAGAGVLLGGDWIDRFRPEFADVFGLQAGRLVRLFPAVCLFVAAQLAYINLWYRVRSRKDFSGRYRVWYFVVPAWLLFCVCTATDAHHMAARLANARWPLPFQNAELLWWMTPTGVALVTFARLLSHEMRRTTGGMLFLWTATITALVNAAVLLGRPMLSEGHALMLVEQGAALLWPASLMLSMLYFARYVIHVSSEPTELLDEEEADSEETEPRPGFFSRWRESRREAKARRAELKAKRAAEKAQRAAEKPAARTEAREKKEAEKKEAAARAAEKKAAAAKSAAAKKPVAAKSEAAASKQAASEASTNRPQKAEPQPAKSSSPAERDGGEDSAKRAPAAKVTRTDRAEPAHDDFDADEDDSMQRLSKKERRRLRKLRRQQANAH